MCIRDSLQPPLIDDDRWRNAESDHVGKTVVLLAELRLGMGCLLYTSDAADERSSVDLGGRRIIKKKT